MTLFLSTLILGCSNQTPAPEAAPEPEPVAKAEPEAAQAVVEIAIRRVKDADQLEAFTSARDAFVGQLKAQPGVGTDREFKSFFDYSINKPPVEPVYIGMTQYASAEAYGKAGQALGASAEAGAFFPLFNPQLFTILVPLDPEEKVDLASIANEEGQVLEVAVRDLSKFENFDQDDYEAKRDAFLEALSQQEGFVAEHQWLSAKDPNIAVGMTVYASQEAFTSVSQNKEFGTSEAVTNMMGTYPPNLGGHINVVLK